MKDKNLKELSDLGLHFGHLRSYTHPKSRAYVYTILNGICVINLEKTKERLKEALAYVKQLAKEDKVILFVGTKRQAREAIVQTAEKIKMPYIHKRFMGGTLTNFETVLQNTKKLRDLEQKIEEVKDKCSKQAYRQLLRKKERLAEVLGGLKDITQLPDALFVVDIVKERNAIFEARRLGIPIIAIVDTNGDPSKIDYPIPANDDSKKGVEFIINQIVEAYLEGKKSTAFKQRRQDKTKESNDA